MHRITRPVVLIGLPLWAFCATVPVTAQSQTGADDQIETFTVTGTRQAYRGQFEPLENPQVEQILDSQALNNAGVENLVTALDLSASVARQNNFGGLWNSFAVRGFVGDENLPSNYLVNGFNAGRGFSGPRDISGIESVEVLKGPKAAIFGRGEPGGTVNIVTKRPTFETAGQVRATYGQFNQTRLDGDFTTPLTDDIAIRLVGFWEEAESFRDTIETSRHGFTPSLAVNLGDATHLVYELEYAHQEIPFDRGVLAVEGELGVIPRSTFLGEPGDGPLEGEVLGHQLEVQHDFDSGWSFLAGLNHRDTSLKGYSTEAELTGSRQLLFEDGETLTRQRRLRDYDATFSAVRAELAGEFETGRLSHRVMLGGDYDEFVNDNSVQRYRAPGLASDPTYEALYAIDIFNPVYGQYPLPEVSPLSDRKETQEAAGLYVQDQITVTDRLDVRLGFRYDDFSQTIEDRRNETVFEQSDQRVSPQAGIVYRVADSISLYAAFGEGFRQLSGTDVEGNGFKPNTTESLEAGVKFELNDGRIMGTASVFSINQENVLVGDPDNPFSLLATGRARSQGFELDVTGEIADGLSLLFSYAYVDAEMRDETLDRNFNQPIPAGARLNNIPEHTLSAQLVKEATAFDRPLNFGGGALHVSDRLGEVATSFELPSYTTLRVFADYSATEQLTLRGAVDNLFDETYYTNSFAALWVEPGAPRTWRLSVDYRF